MANEFAGFSGAPVLEGNWVNPTTHEYFTVRDCFFENNDYIVVTTDNRRLNYNIIQDYVQTSATPQQLEQEYREFISSKQQAKQDDILNTPFNKINPVSTTEPIEGIDPSMQSEIDSLLSGSTPLQQAQQPSVEPPRKLIKDKDIIERALKNIVAPEITLNIVFQDYPTKEIESLIDIMHVDVKSIAQWMYEEYFHNNFEDIIINKISSYIKQAQTQSDEVLQEEQQDEPQYDHPIEQPSEKPTPKTGKPKGRSKPKK